MTQDVDILSIRASELAEELKGYLSKRFHIAMRIREVGEGKGYRIYQIQKPRNRHLVDVRYVKTFPPLQVVEEVLVITPEELTANKVQAFKSRTGSPKSFTDRRDLALLFLTFPELKDVNSPVRERLIAAGADADTLATWARLAAEEIRPDNDEDEFN